MADRNYQIELSSAIMIYLCYLRAKRLETNRSNITSQPMRSHWHNNMAIHGDITHMKIESFIISLCSWGYVIMLRWFTLSHNVIRFVASVNKALGSL